MSYCSTYWMLLDAQKNKYAVPAINVENMEMIQSTIDAATHKNSPIILQTTPSTLKYASPDIFAAIVKAKALKTHVPVALHLDHGDSFELLKNAATSQYTSIMFDGSNYDFNNNIQHTKKAVEIAKKYGLPIEAELGMLSGKEDEVQNENSIYTDPDQAAVFENQTQITSLAISIGTAHGKYENTPKIDLKRLSDIKEKTSVPLVLHGASGLSNEVIKKCIVKGICKINFATQLRVSYTESVRKYLDNNANEFDPKHYGTEAKEYVYQKVCEIIDLCNSTDKAAV